MTTESVIKSIAEDLVLSETLAQFEVLSTYVTTVAQNAQPSSDLADRIRIIEKVKEENHEKLSDEELLGGNFKVLTTTIVRLCKNPRNILVILDKLVSICGMQLLLT